MKSITRYMLHIFGVVSFITIFSLPLMLHGGAWCEISKPLPPGETRWAQIAPEVNMFWKEREEAPFRAKKTAWRIIRILKEFIVNYPASPKIPEAYYLIGIAYKEVGFIPEAISHWRIVAKEFPNSRWADEALMQILVIYDEMGEIEKKKRLLRGIIRQYPDTTSAKAAWIALALESVIKGENIDFIKNEVKKLENAEPELGSKIPLFYELKARLAQYSGDDRRAIDHWVHFLNLTTSQEKQALALYEIGEAYRRLGELIKARKYYALCARDYSRTSFSLFSRFRLAQIHEMEKGLLPWAYKGGGEEESSMWLYQKILDTYPRHPITQDVIYEYAQLKLRLHDLVGALGLVEFYFKINPKGQLEKKFIALSDKIQKEMLDMVKNTDSMDKNLKACLKVVDDKRMSALLPGYLDTAKRLWRKLVTKYMDEGQYVQALKEAVRLRDRFKDDGHLVRFSNDVRAKALGLYFHELLHQKQSLELLDFFYSNAPLIHDVISRNHYFYVAKAWDNLQCHSESSYYYGMAYGEPGTRPSNGELLLVWGKKLALLREKESLGQILNEYDGIAGERKDHDYFHLRYLYEKMNSRWQQAYNYATSGLGEVKDREARKNLLGDLIESASHLGLWDVARDAYNELEGYQTNGEKVAFIESWADIAISSGEFGEAVYLYNLILTIEPNYLNAKLKMALCLMRQGKDAEAEAILSALSVDKDEFIRKMANSLLDDELFWKNVPKKLLQRNGD